MMKTRELLNHLGINYQIPDTNDSFEQFCMISFPDGKFSFLFEKNLGDIKATKKTFKTRN